MSKNRKITADDLEIELDDHTDQQLCLKFTREENYNKAIIKVLSVSKGNISIRTRLLGTSRPTLYSLAKHHKMNIEK